MLRPRGRGGGGRAQAPPTDILICFPRKTHLALLPKGISSPSRSTPRLLQGASPLFKTTTKNNTSSGEEAPEPTSPKVTCSGQIRPRPKSRAERKEGMRTRPNKRRSQWLQALGIKRDFMQLLAAFRGFGFHLACFHGGSADCMTDEENEEEEEEEAETMHAHGEEASKDVFTKWFMLLEENHEHSSTGEELQPERNVTPPRDALVLMRCKSAPSRRWEEVHGRSEEATAADEEKVAVMGYEYEVVKETWLTGDRPMLRSRSCRR